MATYAGLGHGLPDGSVTMVKQLEYLAIDTEVNEAQEAKRKRENV